MCNCNAIVVALLTPCSQMDYEIVVAVAVGQVRKVFNPPQKKRAVQKVFQKNKAFGSLSSPALLEFREFMHNGHTLNS